MSRGRKVGQSHRKTPGGLRVYGKSGPVTTRILTDEERRAKQRYDQPNEGEA